MTARERFLKTIAFSSPDRVPYFDEGLRDGVLEAWRSQGLAADADLSAMFRFDRRERIPVNVDPLPGVKKWPASRRGLASLRRRFDPNDPRRFPADWPARVAAWRSRDHILELSLHPGFFLSLGVEDWARFTSVLYQLSDAPALVREILDIRAQCIAEVADRVLSEVEIDFASFSEPIGGNEGPIISPRLYRDLILESYRPILDVLRRRNVPTIVLVTYANARSLLPAAVEAGFNCLWACEAETKSMDYLAIRRQFGRDLRLIGGIDLDALLADETVIRREMEAKVPALLAQGGYIPLADGRVRENTPFANYAFYRRLLESLTAP
jgi:uroporphyrinogen decarboxylase